MRFRRTMAVAVGTAVAGAAAGLLIGTAPASAAALPAWAVIPSPNNSSMSGLSGITAAGPTNLWAVGSQQFSSVPPQPMILHDSGSGWHVVSGPWLSGGGTFRAVAAIGASDIWAVGSKGTGTLAAHYDGTRWTLVPTPAGVTGVLTAVSARSTTDVWAVGQQAGPAPLIEHWNGTAWTVVPSPAIADPASLAGVAAISATDVWAVGQSGDEFTVPLVEHWNGSAWSVVTVPHPPLTDDGLGLRAVTAVSATDVWAVGSSRIVEHWNGAAWTVVPAPAGSKDPEAVTALTGVSARSASDIWAVGVVSASTGPHTVTEHWNGTAWSLVPSPNPSPGTNFLSGVVAPVGGPATAAGYYQQGTVGLRTLILRDR